MSPAKIRKDLRAAASAKVAAGMRRFFKTGCGEYGEGDQFLGLKVPQVRLFVQQSDALSEDDILHLLRSKWHEERLLALRIIVRRFEKLSDEKSQARWVKLYLANTSHINNWDLVDASAPQVLGVWLLTHDRKVLRKLAKSKSLWERRIAIVATHSFIRAGQFDDTLHLVRSLLNDRQDLMHKACGWMLREVGKKDKAVLVCFLKQHLTQMPRTALRYAIERFPEPERLGFLRGGEAEMKA